MHCTDGTKAFSGNEALMHKFQNWSKSGLMPDWLLCHFAAESKRVLIPGNEVRMMEEAAPLPLQ
jgi:hypothetical protein